MFNTYTVHISKYIANIVVAMYTYILLIHSILCFQVSQKATNELMVKSEI